MTDTVATNQSADTGSTNTTFRSLSDMRANESVSNETWSNEAADNSTTSWADETPGDEYQDNEVVDENTGEETFEVKVYGQTTKLTKDEMLTLAQKQIAGEMKLDQIKAEAAKVKAERDAIQRASAGMDGLFKQFASGDINKIASAWNMIAQNVRGVPQFSQLMDHYVDTQLQLMSMSPEERAHMQLQQERAAFEAERQRLMREQQSKQEQASMEESYSRIQSELPPALQEAGLPNTPRVLRRVGEVWATALKQGKNPSPVQVAKFVKQELEREKLDDLQNMNEDDLLKKLPQDVIRKINAASVKQVRAQQPKPKASLGEVATKKNDGYMSLAEWKKSRKF